MFLHYDCLLGINLTKYVLTYNVCDIGCGLADFDYKSNSGSSQYKFSILTKIVRFMKVIRSGNFILRLRFVGSKYFSLSFDYNCLLCAHALSIFFILLLIHK